MDHFVRGSRVSLGARKCFQGASCRAGGGRSKPGRRASVSLVTETDDEPTTGELRAVQVSRESQERRAAEQADSEEETAQHDRRAEKSAYLREKLEEREKAERRAE